jgi:hypothetical protein
LTHREPTKQNLSLTIFFSIMSANRTCTGSRRVLNCAAVHGRPVQLGLLLITAIRAAILSSVRSEETRLKCSSFFRPTLYCSGICKQLLRLRRRQTRGARYLHISIGFKGFHAAQHGIQMVIVDSLSSAYHKLQRRNSCEVIDGICKKRRCYYCSSQFY